MEAGENLWAQLERQSSLAWQLWGDGRLQGNRAERGLPVCGVGESLEPFKRLTELS